MHNGEEKEIKLTINKTENFPNKELIGKITKLKTFKKLRNKKIESLTVNKKNPNLNIIILKIMKMILITIKTLYIKILYILI